MRSPPTAAAAEALRRRSMASKISGIPVVPGSPMPPLGWLRLRAPPAEPLASATTSDRILGLFGMDLLLDAADLEDAVAAAAAAAFFFFFFLRPSSSASSRVDTELSVRRSTSPPPPLPPPPLPPPPLPPPPLPP